MKMKSTKSKLMASLLVMVLCVTAFFGSTYAWFTDSVTSSGNIIQAGNLDATLEYHDGTQWKDASSGAIFDYDKWEPGYTVIRKVKIGNAGDLAFQFMLNIIPSAIPETDAPDLADVIDVYMFTGSDAIDRDDVKSATSKGTLAQLMADGDGAAHGVLYPEGATNTPAGAPVKELEVTIALKMQESAGNEYMNASVGGGFKVQLLATQLAYEGDSFGPDYDIDADYTPDYGIFKEVTATATAVADAPTVILDESGVKATVPANAVAAGTELELKVTPSPDTVPDGFLVTEDQAILNYEIKMENLPSDNTKAITVELPLAKGLQNVELYHNGVKIASSYNAETGILSFTTTSFSPFTVVYGKNTIDAVTPDADPEDEDVILIGTAAELAGLAKAVNEGNTFEGKTVKLTADIDLRNAEWTPIGNGNIGGFGSAFKGTFDGQNYTVKNLKVNNDGWAGLFGLAHKATIKNVKIDNVNLNSSRMTGAVVGQIYGNVENCHVSNVKITVVPNSDGSGYDNGDKVGGVVGWVGENSENRFVTNCSATNVILKAYRDVGGIVGYLANNNTITGSTANDVEITVDQVTNFYGAKDYNAGAIVGRKGTGIVEKDNTSGDFKVSVVVATADALANAIAAGENVTLGANIDLGDTTITVPADKDVLLNLNGKTLSYKSTEAKASAAIDNKGTLTLTGGTVTYEGVGDPSFGYGTNTIHNTGKLVIDGATIINTTNGGSSVAIDNAAGAELIINSGIIQSEKNAIRLCPFSNAAINCTINGGTITGARAVQIQLPSNKPADAPDINLTVNGGTLTGKGGLAIYSYSSGQSFANVDVTLAGGTFNGDVCFGGGNAKSTQENVTVTGGTFNGELGRYLENDGWVDIAKP